MSYNFLTTLVNQVSDSTRTLFKANLEDLAENVSADTGADKDEILKSIQNYTVKPRKSENIDVDIDENEVLIVTDYGKKFPAAFGMKLEEIRKDISTLKKSGFSITYNSNLKMGPGWVLSGGKKDIPKFTKFLGKYDISVREVCKEEIEGSSKPSKIKVNKWDNRINSDGVILLELPVGANGREVDVAIGFQYKEADPRETSGLDTVLPLDQDTINECIEKRMKVLDSKMLLKIKEKKLRKQLRALIE